MSKERHLQYPYYIVNGAAALAPPDPINAHRRAPGTPPPIPRTRTSSVPTMDGRFEQGKRISLDHPAYYPYAEVTRASSNHNYAPSIVGTPLVRVLEWGGAGIIVAHNPLFSHEPVSVFLDFVGVGILNPHARMSARKIMP